MALYRCQFLDADDHIKALEEINAGSLLDAIDRANAMLNERSHHDVVEVWAGNKWVCRAARDRDATSEPEQSNALGVRPV